MRLALFFLTSFLAFMSVMGVSAGDESNKPTCLPPHRVKAGLDWIRANYASTDSRDPQYIDKFIGENTVIKFASNPPTVGREQLRTSLDWQWGATTSISHALEEIFIFEDKSIVQTTATYHYTDGTVLSGSAYTVSVKAPEDQYPSEIRIYGDFNAVFAKFIEIAGPPPSR